MVFEFGLLEDFRLCPYNLDNANREAKMNTTINIVICDDDPLCIAVWEDRLNLMHPLNVRASFTNITSCKRYLQKNISTVDVLLLDIWFGPEPDGLDFLQELRSLHPNLPVVMMSSEYKDILKAIMEGAKSFIPKNSPKDVMEAFQAVTSGKTFYPKNIHGFISSQVSGMDASKNILKNLSPEEIQLIKLRSKGFTQEEICEFLKISPEAYNQKVQNIHSKTNLPFKQIVSTLAVS